MTSFGNEPLSASYLHYTNRRERKGEAGIREGGREGEEERKGEGQAKMTNHNTKGKV